MRYSTSERLEIIRRFEPLPLAGQTYAGQVGEPAIEFILFDVGYGSEVFNASRRTKLTAFPRVDFDQVKTRAQS